MPDDDLLEDQEVQRYLQEASTHEFAEVEDTKGHGSEGLQSGYGVKDVAQSWPDDVKEEAWDEQDWQNWGDWQHWDWQSWDDPLPWAWSVKREQDSNDYQEDLTSSSSKPSKEAYPPWAFKEKKRLDGLAGNLGRQDKLGGEYTLDGYTDPTGKSWKRLGFAIFVISVLLVLFGVYNLSIGVHI